MPVAQTVPFSLSFGSVSTIYQTEIRCHVNENQYNMSLNPSISDCSGSIKDNVSGSEFKPYVTTVGLYNAVGELLIVAKLGQPLPLPSNTDVTFLIRYDN